MRTHTIRLMKDSPETPVLYIAFELGHKKWLIRFGDLKRTRDVEIAVRDIDRMQAEIGKAKERFDLPKDCASRSCSEAGWDGFWLARYLRGTGVENLVVDPASIEVSRRSRRVKTDRVDVGKLFGLLLRHARGRRSAAWSTFRVRRTRTAGIFSVNGISCGRNEGVPFLVANCVDMDCQARLQKWNEGLGDL